MRKTISLALSMGCLISTGARAQTVNIISGSNWAPSAALVMNGGIGVKLKGTVDGSKIGPAVISNASMSVWTDPATVMRNVNMSGLFIVNAWREGIRISGMADGVTIASFNVSMRSIPQTNDQLPSGIALMSGKNITISGGVVSGFKTLPVPNSYANGDGIAAERAVDGLSITDVDSSDNSDAGFDLKSSRTLLRNLSASRNFRNYRFWGSVQASKLISNDASNAHVWVGAGAEVVIDKLVATSKTAALIFYVDGAKSLTVKSCELSVPKGTKLIYKATPSSIINLGAGCVLP